MKRKLLAAGLLVLALTALLCQAAFASAVCQPGDKGEQVHIVQLRLHTLGYLAEEPVSPYKYGDTTKAAVKLFQKAASLSVTGTVDEITFARLTSASAISYEDYIEGLKDAQNKLGASGPYALETKTRLKKLGYLSGTLTNKYDGATVSAVKLFQTAHNLTPSGAADRATRDVLFGDSAMSYGDYCARNNVTVVKLGSKGEQVTVVQTQLSKLGYFTGAVDGVFAKTTQAAVKLFQNAHNIADTGIADETTRALLNGGNAKKYEDYAAEQALTKVSLGDAGLAVELLQTRLTELYYYGGAISGSFTADVQTAVERFQNANNVNVSGTVNHGIATVATRKAMNAASAIDRVAAEGLLPGDKLDAVNTMTARLKKLGFIAGTTSTYTSAVKKAVKIFQKANKLTVTGKADPDTLEKLFSDGAVSYDEYKNGSGNTKIEKAIAVAYKQLGKPYSNSANPPNSFDCSRFTAFVFSKVGVSMTGEVESQAKTMAKKYGKITAMGELKRGDLLYFDTQTDKNPGHAALYLGKVNGVNSFIHASSAAGKVVVSPFKTWYQERFEWGVRVF